MVSRLWKTKDAYSTWTNELASTWSTEHKKCEIRVDLGGKNKVLHTQGTQTFSDSLQNSCLKQTKLNSQHVLIHWSHQF